jgi:very-short-patch-repair endonuclease
MSDKHMDEFWRALDSLLDDYATQAADDFEMAAKRCESPMERLLFSRLFFLCDGWGGRFRMPTLRSVDEPRDTRTAVIPQFVVGSYRLDFAVVTTIDEKWLPAAPRSVRVAVEVDGHEFHEKTKEQAARDKARDRFLTAKGWLVMRFTGSEVFRDPAGCVRQVEDLVASQVEVFVNAHLLSIGAAEPNGFSEPTP